jgi:O-acetyl-ADP-ribose deacetylase (regulator of RNase III)
MKLIEQNITETDLLYVAHGCNKQGVFNKGVAKDIREKWPLAYKYYMLHYQTTALGNYIQAFIPGENEKVILNIITQNSYGNFGKHASYFHVINGLHKAIQYYNIKRMAIPKIGCSLGGLKWETMEILLKELEDLTGVEFYVYYQ